MGNAAHLLHHIEIRDPSASVVFHSPVSHSNLISPTTLTCKLGCSSFPAYEPVQHSHLCQIVLLHPCKTFQRLRPALLVILPALFPRPRALPQRLYVLLAPPPLLLAPRLHLCIMGWLFWLWTPRLTS